MQILKKSLQLAAVLFLAALIFLFSSRNWLIELATPLLLQRAGFQEMNISGVSLDNTSCSLQEFSLTKDLASGNLEITAQDIHINFTLKQLIDGRVNNLEIDSLNVTWTASPSKTVPGEAFTVDQLPRLLEALTGKILPVDLVEIKNLQLYAAELGPFSGRPLQATLHHTDTGLKSTIRYQPGPENTFQLQGELNDDATAHLRLHIREENVSPIAFELTLTEKQVRGHLDCILDRLNLVQPFFILPLPELSGKLAADFSIDMTSSSHALKVTLTGDHLQYSDWQARDLRLDLNLSDLPTGSTVILGPSSRLVASALRIKGIRADYLDIDLAGRLHHQNNQYHISFTPLRPWLVDSVLGSGFEVEQLSIVPPKSILTKAGGIVFRTDASFEITAKQFDFTQYHTPILTLRPGEKNKETVISFNGEDWELQSGQWLTGESTVNNGFITLQSAPLQLHLKNIGKSTSGLSAALDFSTDSLSLTANERHLPFEKMKGSLLVGDSRINGEITWELEDNPGTLQLLLTHNLHKRSGSATLQTKPVLELDGNSHTLGALINPLQLPVTLETGMLALQARAQWTASSPLRLDTDIHLSQGVGAIRELPFSGLEIEHNLQILPQLKSFEQGKISIARVNGPVTIEDLGLRLAIHPSDKTGKPLLMLQDIGCQLLGGTIKIDALTYDFNQPDAAFTVQVQDLELPELLTIQQVKGLDISGKVEGNLPVSFSKGKFSIDNGSVHNSPGGGTIHYKPPNGYSKDSHLTGYALKALEEFHYNQLKAEVNYNPDGNLIVAMHLQGKSPKLKTNRPVHLNITTEQNLLSLLKSLKYSKSLTDELDSQLQQHYRNPPAN